ncbi:MAG: SurA-like protein [Parcubacteria group bacterium GW2011_GWF2_44_8]|nr:MAG: SurA-like protein [Parcubacteria group bacterium GW2011_GWF2_44_8]
MDEKKQDDTSGIMPEAVPETVETTMTGVPVTETVEVPMGTSEAAPTKFNFKAYGAMVVGILVIAAGLLFVLEKEGRTSTGVFSGIISSMEEGKPVARVNDVEILMSDFTSSYDQLLEMSSSQGMDVSDPALLEQLRTQAVDTLVNAEVLRQAAIAAGMTATEEQIQTRFTEIQDGLGGAEALAARMAEFGVTEASLRRDIENEFLIQGLFDANIDSANLTATEEELTALYDQAGGVEAGLPPMAEIKDQIEAQIIFDKEQKLISAFIESLRAEATIEVLI